MFLFSDQPLIQSQANVLIKDDHRACLADFGLSTITALNASNNPATGATRGLANLETSLPDYHRGGTALWMSPELLCPEMFKFTDNRPTPQSDCYALGMVIYEVCRHHIAVEPPK